MVATFCSSGLEAAVSIGFALMNGRRLVAKEGRGTKPRSRGFGYAGRVGLLALATLIAGVAPSWVGLCGVPAPLVGVTGPSGLLVAGTAYGGYLL
jgi:hypothetical protein